MMLFDWIGGWIELDWIGLMVNNHETSINLGCSLSLRVFEGAKYK